MNALTIAVLLLWLLTLVRTLVNLRLVPRLRVGPIPRDPQLVSIIVPARDEEREIGRAVAAFLAQSWPALEVIVVNDRSTDGTAEILARLEKEAGSRLQVIQGVEPPPGWLGKPWALDQGSRVARGDLLLFVDADVIYAPDAVAAAVASLEEGRFSMIALLPRIEMRGFWEHVLMPNLAFFAFSVLPLWLTNRTRIVALGVGGGTGNLVRREAYDAAGGHEALRDAVVDDVALARIVRRAGARTGVVRSEGLVSVRMYHGGREVVQGFTKNIFAVIKRSYVGAALLVALGFVVHCLPYLLALQGDLLAIATVGTISLTRLILFRALGYRLDNALLGHPLMMLAWLWILLRSVWITGVRRRLVWRGRAYDAGETRFGGDGRN